MKLLFLTITLLTSLINGSLIVDNDADLDDLGALMYILARQASTNQNNLKAITVSSNGWSNQWSGVINNQRVLQQFGCNIQQVPITYGRSPGYTILKTSFSDNLAFDGAHYEQNPNQTYLTGIDSVFTSGCANFTWPVVPHATYPLGSVQLLKKTIRNNSGDIDILMLGPYTNMAELIQNDPTILEDIRIIYISSGYGVNGTLETNMNVEEVAMLQQDLSASRSDYNSTKKHPNIQNGGQNIYIDANAASFVYASIAMCQRDLDLGGQGTPEGLQHPKSCPEVVMMSGMATHDLPLSTKEENDLLCGENCDSSVLHLDVKSYYDNMPVCGNEDMDAIMYWDQSAALLAMGQDEFCDKWITRKVTVPLVDGPFFGTLLYDEKFGAQIKACARANRDKFLERYWAAFDGLEDGVDACNNQLSSSRERKSKTSFLRIG